MELTSDDMKKLDKPLTGADWVRILRDAHERTEDPVIGCLLDAILRDHGFGARLRRELAAELPTCTPRELSMLHNTLIMARKTPDDPSDRKPDEPVDEVAPLPGAQR